jgi:Helix-turn-helix domain
VTERYLGTNELAARLGYSPWWVRFLARSGRLPCRRVGAAGRLLFDPAEVEAALGRVAPQGPTGPHTEGAAGVPSTAPTAS